MPFGVQRLATKSFGLVDDKKHKISANYNKIKLGKSHRTKQGQKFAK
jgi:hypothetical protein